MPKITNVWINFSVNMVQTGDMVIRNRLRMDR